MKKPSFKLLAFIACLFLYLLLLWKNPFNERNLISNLEPFPDTFQYIAPAFSLLKGGGIKLTRENRFLNPNVPPGYSLVLFPVFLIKADPRMFYFANVILALLSFSLFYLLVYKLVRSLWVVGIVSWFYVTNYYIYWFPTVAMAENLLLLLFLLGVWIFVGKLNTIKALIAGILPTMLVATKYAAAPLAFAFLLLYIWKLFFNKKDIKKLIKPKICFFSSLIISILLYSTIEYLLFGRNIYLYIFYFAGSIFSSSINNAVNILDINIIHQPNEGFSLVNFRQNLSQYIGYLIGEPAKVLWNSNPLISKMVSILGLSGLIIGTHFRVFKQLSFSLIFIILTSVFFFSTFNPVDARYIFYIIPILLFGVAFFLDIIKSQINKRGFNWIFLLIIIGIIISYVATDGTRVYHQIGLNIKGVETPWYYVSIQLLNEYFTYQDLKLTKKPIVITSLPPYLVDFYSNGSYTLLPLSKKQDFRCCMTEVWGENDYSDLLKLYERYLKDGYQLYVGGFGVENQEIYSEDFKKIKEKFLVVKVAEGCYNLCNIYRVELKNENK